MKTRRKAVASELVEESKTNPGYFKYRFTIREVDGTEKVIPAYGKDMEDALERLTWTERSQKKTYNIVAISALLTVVIVPSVIAGITNNMYWVIGSVSLSALFGIVMVRVDKYFNRS